MAGALDHFTAVRDAVCDRRPSRVLADALLGRAWSLREQMRIDEAVEDTDTALALTREIGYPAGEVLALAHDWLRAAANRDSATLLARGNSTSTTWGPGRSRSTGAR